MTFRDGFARSTHRNQFAGFGQRLPCLSAILGPSAGLAGSEFANGLLITPNVDLWLNCRPPFDSSAFFARILSRPSGSGTPSGD